LATVVVALDAVIHVRGQGGDYTLVANDLFVPPSENITIMHRLQGGDILTAVEVPVRGSRRSAFVKNTVRNAWDFSRASAAVALDINGSKARNVRVVLGGVAAVPWRSQSAEQALEGTTFDEKSIEAAASAAADGASPLRYNGYKVGLVRRVVREALTQLTT
jgi:xanthine dehydrogenase YagS FAD-binding subunit